MDWTKIVRVISDFFASLGKGSPTEKPQAIPVVVLPPPPATVVTIDVRSATDIALLTSSDFEGDDGYAGVVGNFDGMGLTCGALGWTWALGDQQKMLLSLDKKCKGLVQSLMPSFGERYLFLARSAIKDSLPEISSWSKGASVLPAQKKELMALWGCPQMISVQRDVADDFARYAASESIKWCSAVQKAKVNSIPLWVYCFFFDLRVMNGGLKGIVPEDVTSFMSSSEMSLYLDVIIDWCEKADSTMAAYKDCNKNALYWQSNYCEALKHDPAYLMHKVMFVLGYMRAMKARPEYRAATMNRRGIMALGGGWSEGVRKDLSAKHPGYMDLLVGIS